MIGQSPSLRVLWRTRHLAERSLQHERGGETVRHHVINTAESRRQQPFLDLLSFLWDKRLRTLIVGIDGYTQSAVPTRQGRQRDLPVGADRFRGRDGGSSAGDLRI